MKKLICRLRGHRYTLSCPCNPCRMTLWPSCLRCGQDTPAEVEWNWYEGGTRFRGDCQKHGAVAMPPGEAPGRAASERSRSEN